MDGWKAWRRATWHVVKDIVRIFVGGYGWVTAVAAYIGIGVGALVGNLLGHGCYLHRSGYVTTVYASTRGPWLFAGIVASLLLVVFVIAVRHQHTLHTQDGRSNTSPSVIVQPGATLIQVFEGGDLHVQAI